MNCLNLTKKISIWAPQWWCQSNLQSLLTPLSKSLSREDLIFQQNTRRAFNVPMKIKKRLKILNLQDYILLKQRLLPLVSKVLILWLKSLVKSVLVLPKRKLKVRALQLNNQRTWRNHWIDCLSQNQKPRLENPTIPLQLNWVSIRAWLSLQIKSI